MISNENVQRLSVVLNLPFRYNVLHVGAVAVSESFGEIFQVQRFVSALQRTPSLVTRRGEEPSPMSITNETSWRTSSTCSRFSVYVYEGGLIGDVIPSEA